MIRWKMEIGEIAARHGYELEQAQEAIGLLIFVKPGVQVNIYTTQMTVGTSLKHPKQGRTQLFRRGVTLRELEAIFKNPRVHGLGGYQVT